MSNTIIDADTGSVYHSQWQTQRAEEQIQAFAFPAKLPKGLIRALAAELLALTEERNKGLEDLNGEPFNPYEVFPLEQLSPEDRALFRTYTRAEQALRKAQQTMEDIRANFNKRNLFIDGNGFSRKKTPDEIAAHSRARDDKQAAYRAETKVIADRFKAIIEELARAELQKLKTKIPATVMAQIQAITRPDRLLPEKAGQQEASS